MIEPAGVGIHQVLVAASPGDAITNLALGTRDLLRQVGPSEIFAHHIAPALRGEVLPLARYRTGHSHEPVDLPRVDRPVRGARVPDVARPSRSCSCTTTSRRADTSHRTTRCSPSCSSRPRARSSGCGRGSCARSPTRSYNARELEAMGYHDVRVIPPVVDLRRLVDGASRGRRRCITSRRFERTDPALRRTADAAQATRLPRADDARRRDVPRDATATCCSSGTTGSRATPRDPRAGAGAATSPECTSSGAVDEPDLAAMFRVRRRGRDRERARGLLRSAARGDDLREADRRARPARRSPRRSATARCCSRRDHGPTFFAEAIAELLSNEPAAPTRWSTGGRRRLAELERRPPDVAIVEALLEVV